MAQHGTAWHSIARLHMPWSFHDSTPQAQCHHEQCCHELRLVNMHVTQSQVMYSPCRSQYNMAFILSTFVPCHAHVNPPSTQHCSLGKTGSYYLQTHQGIVLQSGFQDVEVLGVVPLPPLPDQDLPSAKKQLESFRSEAGVILAEANAADDLAAPLAVAAAEAENLTLDQLGKKENRKYYTIWRQFHEKPRIIVGWPAIR